ncbi:MAG: cytochrome c4 [Acetobacteraceae bacterium]|nr:cytochrome c4 [Acetobacteraceae bacterium]
MEPAGTSRANRWWRLSLTVWVFSFLGLTAFVGFIAVPVIQSERQGIGALTAICRAIGILPGSPAERTPLSEAKAQPTSLVAWNTATLNDLFNGDKQAGAKIAEGQCGACHAPDGSTPDPTIPRMAGQSAFAIYKQLHDFKSGSRVNEIMSAQVENLDDKQIADVAAFYSGLVRGDLDAVKAGYAGAEARDLIERGDSTRALPACNACHGVRAGGPIETPTLTGQYQQYLSAQLHAFAKGDRHNDIYERMRSVASKLTDREMDLLTRFYASPNMQQ